MTRKRHSDLEFQLAYLIDLTRAGLKPLSRWEGRLDKATCDRLRAQGLRVGQATRRTRLGRRRTETLFAGEPGPITEYLHRFDDTPFGLTPEAIRTEGRLFGYPACCIEAFARTPYTPNGLARADQAILFHWACPDCRETPALLREYRRVHAACLRRLAIDRRSVRPSRLGDWLRSDTGRLAASLALALGLTGAARADDPHQLPMTDDGDVDGLSVSEEILRGTDWWNADTDADGTEDGPQAALLLRQLIDTPPAGVVVTDNLAWGLETCSICGETVNMGFVEITHTQRGLTVQLPYIVLHYLEHGSLSYDGDLHQGRIDLDLLKRILLPCDANHLLPWYEPDPDEDGLTTDEEPLLGTDPAVPDTDGDSLNDGPQVAEDLLAHIAALPREVCTDTPYLQEWQANGLEQCEVCGITLNMGLVEITNPLIDLSVQVPYVALHTLAHGGFAYDGTANDGRLLATVLQTVLTGDGTAHWLAIDDDGDGDGLTDPEEDALGLETGNPDQNGNTIPDGRELAQDLATRVNALPVGPLPDQIHALDHLAYGFYNCQICGAAVNMGTREIVDPFAGTSLYVPYYNLHFMQHGSFTTDRPTLYPRQDPVQLAALVGSELAGVTPGPGARGFSFWNAPNPFGSGSETTITLALPLAAGDLHVAIYDAAGRKVRDLFTAAGEAAIHRFVWDGRDQAGGKVPAGLYLCRAQVGDVTLTRKVTVVH